jgi:pimeloyl-ACP methyl ester carboxylesterase
MDCLRTPEERFAALPGWPYRPHYLDDLAGFEGIRIHYVDEPGRDGAPTALCLHGNPSWSYLYRKMIPVFAQAGLRIVAPDLIGFGRSDKPKDASVHRFDWHRGMLHAFVERLDLHDVMLVCQDWGGILGLTLPVLAPQRFSRLLVMNTMLACGEPPTEGFRQWRAYSDRTPDLDVGRMLQRGKPDLSDAEAAAFNAPFPDARYKAALRAFPGLVPDATDAAGAAESREAARFLSEVWSGASFVAIGAQDPVLGGEPMRRLCETIRGCPPALVVPDAGHFVPEWGESIATAALTQFGIAR